MGKLIENFKLDWLFLRTDNIFLTDKISFMMNKYYCILINKREINYLGLTFHYDNRFVPAILQMFPNDISNLDKDINLKEVNTLLDVGSNIGQFSFTMKRIYSHIETYCFEPNKEPFKLLVKNIGGSKLFNCGLGREGKKDFYYNVDCSAEGSLIPNKKNNIKTKVKIVNITKLNIPKEFDLVKIDVEGSELEVLESLNKIKFKYLYIESVNGNNLVEIIDKVRNRNPKLISFRDNLNLLLRMEK